MAGILLTTAYFAPVQYFSKFLGTDMVFIEAQENYQKQSYRNRLKCLTANGVVNLSIPVKQGRSPGIPIKEVRIDYDTNWRKIHYRTIKSAYTHAPFYEFLIDDLMCYWEKKYNFLLDYNLEITNYLVNVLNINCLLSLTDEYKKTPVNGIHDYREIIHPKKNETLDQEFVCPDYFQVFTDRFPFQPNLSILDLLFNLGNTAQDYLLQTHKPVK